MGYIYKITNTVNGKVYIGQTIRKLENRINQHFNRSSSPALHNAIEKYGRDAFTLEILHEALDIFLDDLEIAEIKRHNSLAPHGYNLTGGGSANKVFSDQTRKKMSDAAKGRTNKNKGKTPAPETRQKISESLKGRPLSPERRRKISESLKGRKCKPRSPEARRKLSEANKGKTLSPEHRRKLSEAHKGKTPSPETRQKMSEAHAHADRPAAFEILNSLPESMPLKEKRKLLCDKFRERNKGTVHSWVKKWSETTSSSYAPSNRHIAFEILNSLPESMSLTERRRILREKFPEIKYWTIHYWVKKWAKTPSN